MTRSSPTFSLAVVAVVAFVLGGAAMWTVRRRLAPAPRSALAAHVVHSDSVEGDQCPVLTSWGASPLQTSSPRGTISVSASASDADPGDRLTYEWTATAGSFADPRAPVTTFTCTTPGDQTLTMSVRDDHHPGPCKTSLKILVTCVP
jgi:hypothetical protein